MPHEVYRAGRRQRVDWAGIEHRQFGAPFSPLRDRRLKLNPLLISDQLGPAEVYQEDFDLGGKSDSIVLKGELSVAVEQLPVMTVAYSAAHKPDERSDGAAQSSCSAAA